MFQEEIAGCRREKDQVTADKEDAVEQGSDAVRVSLFIDLYIILDVCVLGARQ